MSRLLRTILVSSIAVLGIGVLLTPLSFALAEDNLVVEFEETPLFDEANFLPGEGITRWAKVTNNSDGTKRIAVEAINVEDPDNFGAVLNLEIKEGGVTRYNNALSSFFNAGEVFLSELAGGGATSTYDFIVTFFSGASDSFQGKTLKFDLLIGFQGTEGGLLPGAGGGAGGFLPPGLTIQDESVRITEIEETSVTIEWTTSYPATSYVLYAKEWESHTLDLTDNSGTPPKYGYANTTPEQDVDPKVTFHSVTITGLTPGTTYFFRAVSHASLAVSREYAFTTLETREEPLILQEETVPLKEQVIQTEEGEITQPGEEIILPEQMPVTPLKEREQERNLAQVLAANIAGALRGIGALTWKTILVILVLIVLVLIGMRAWYKAQKKKK